MLVPKGVRYRGVPLYCIENKYGRQQRSGNQAKCLTPYLSVYTPTYSSGFGGIGGPGCIVSRTLLISRMICWAIEMILTCDKQPSQLWRKMNPVLISCCTEKKNYLWRTYPFFLYIFLLLSWEKVFLKCIPIKIILSNLLFNPTFENLAFSVL